ncbi:hypothetical protein TIFTF001_026288 [Ficus carica]|uniref:Uncharacterized protein n=1 Tax=Ficus carica TaxID=3494 RepID=A0AA88DLC0_FICCA|nr:hypothetical protein TIFTF001_026288 [Ficus carica]
MEQISTLVGNLTPSHCAWEVLFTMVIIGLGLLLFALLIGNMQNFLQSLGWRRLEMSLKRRDVEGWMRYQRLPVELRKQVRRAERYNRAANRGVDEEILLECLPKELQRDIRHPLFKFVKKVKAYWKEEMMKWRAKRQLMLHQCYSNVATVKKQFKSAS